MNKNKPLIGISSCLLGNPVRYNKGNTQDKWILQELSQFVEFFPVCPEVEMGLGTPREEIHLYYTNDEPKVPKLRSKHTKKELSNLAEKSYEIMNQKSDQKQLDGFILMRKSPSCGIANIKTVSEDEKGNIKFMQGLYAKNLESRYPSLPKQDNGRLKNESLREHFIKKVFAHYRFSELDHKISALQDFHKRYKYVLMEHDQDQLKILGNIVANQKKEPIDLIFDKYKSTFFTTLDIPASIKNRYNVLQHLMGYFKNEINREDKENVIEIFSDYKKSLTSYNISINIINFIIKKYKIEYLLNHYYFNLYPKELKINKTL